MVSTAVRIPRSCSDPAHTPHPPEGARETDPYPAPSIRHSQCHVQPGRIHALCPQIVHIAVGLVQDLSLKEG